MKPLELLSTSSFISLSLQTLPEEVLLKRELKEASGVTFFPDNFLELLNTEPEPDSHDVVFPPDDLPVTSAGCVDKNQTAFTFALCFQELKINIIHTNGPVLLVLLFL